jgi:hypothetical protein
LNTRDIREFVCTKGAFSTHIDKIDPGIVVKLPIGVQARERTAEEKHSEVGGNGSELPPRLKRRDEIT